MKRQNTIRALAAALALSVLNLTVAGATDVTDDINPEDFTVRINNPFFPLPPGLHERWVEGGLTLLQTRIAMAVNASLSVRMKS